MAHYGSLPFNEAIDFIRGKIPIPTETWADITNAMHGRAFVVAGANKMEIVSDFHKAILGAIENGTDISRFRKDFDAIVEKYGWSYNGKRGWRTNIILDTNLSTAYSAGREKQRRTEAVVKAFPNDTYRSMDDGRVRPLHKSWDGVTLPWDDPWWDTHTAPCGWGCRCWKEPSAGKPDKQAPNDGTVAWKNPATGKTEYIPAGIDPGFAYNPADAAWGKFINKKLIARAESGKFTDISPLQWSDYNRPDKIPVDTTITTMFADRAKTAADVRNYLQQVVGDESYYRNPLGETIYVGQAIADHIAEKPKNRIDGRERYFPFIREVIESPYEIWINFAQDENGRVLARQRYIKGFELTKKRSVKIIAEIINNMLTAFDLFQGDIKSNSSFRKGRLIYGRK